MPDNFFVLDRPAAADWAPTDHGLLTWPYDVMLCSTSSAAVAGTLYFQRLHLPTPAVVTNVVLSVATLGTTLTAGQNFAALYRADGTLVAVTADQTTPWSSAGVKTAALVGGPYNLPAGDYYVAYWANGTTPPAFFRGNNAGGVLNIGRSTPNLRVGTADTALTTTAPPTMGAQTGAGTAGWAGLS